MISIFYLFIFLLGLAVGSFLNCVVYRLEKGKSFLRGRSYCVNCRHALSWQDLIPVFSFLFLRAKCRYCKKPISFQYPLVEISTGLIFLLIFNFQFPTSNEFSIFNFQTLLSTIYYLLIPCLLIVIFVFDLKHYIIPDGAVYSGIAAAFLYYLVFIIFDLFRISNFEFRIFESLINPFLSALGASAFFLLIFLISQGKWLGFGDVKLAFFMGFLLGFPDILAALFLAFLIGAIIGVWLIIFGKKKLSSEVPFGPFLIAGTFLTLFFGEKLINWYLSFITI